MLIFFFFFKSHSYSNYGYLYQHHHHSTPASIISTLASGSKVRILFSINRFVWDVTRNIWDQCSSLHICSCICAEHIGRTWSSHFFFVLSDLYIESKFGRFLMDEKMKICCYEVDISAIQFSIGKFCNFLEFCWQYIASLHFLPDQKPNLIVRSWFS